MRTGSWIGFSTFHQAPFSSSDPRSRPWFAFGPVLSPSGASVSIPGDADDVLISFPLLLNPLALVLAACCVSLLGLRLRFQHGAGVVVGDRIGGGQLLEWNALLEVWEDVVVVLAIRWSQCHSCGSEVSITKWYSVFYN